MMKPEFRKLVCKKLSTCSIQNVKIIDCLMVIFITFIIIMLSHYQIQVKQIFFLPSVIVGYKFRNCSPDSKEVFTISYNLFKVDCFLITYKTHHGIPICKKNCYYATRSVHLLLNRDK